MTIGKTIALTRWTFVGKVMSLLLNMLSRLVITFLPSSKHLLYYDIAKSLQMVTAAMKLKDAYSLEGKLWPTYITYSKAETLLCQTKVCLVKIMVFPVVMYGCKSWTMKKAVWKNWCFWTVVLEKTLESPLDCKKIQTTLNKSMGGIFAAYRGETARRSSQSILK